MAKAHKLKYKKQNENIKKIRGILIIFIILAVSISIVTVLARYITKSINNYFMESKEFYFYSDKLTEEGANHQVDNWSGVEDYTIVINMNSMENNLKKASYDIGYNVTYTCSDNIICQLSKTEGNIRASTNYDTFSLRITPNAIYRNGDTVWVEITAVSTGEYKKELKATFTLVVGQENVTYQIDDQANNSYLELNITNTQSYYIVEEAFDSYNEGQRIDVNTYLQLSEENKQKCYSGEVTLTFDPREVQIDMTDKNYLNAFNISSTNVNGYTYINTMTLKVDALSSENVRFYKTDKSKDYTYPIVNEDSIIEVNIK